MEKNIPGHESSLRVAHSGHPCDLNLRVVLLVKSRLETGRCQRQHTDSGNSANTQSPLVSRELKRVFPWAPQPGTRRDETWGLGKATRNNNPQHLTRQQGPPGNTCPWWWRRRPSRRAAHLARARIAVKRRSETKIPTMRCQEQSHLPPCPQPTEQQTQSQPHPTGGEIQTE